MNSPPGLRGRTRGFHLLGAIPEVVEDGDGNLKNPRIAASADLAKRVAEFRLATNDLCGEQSGGSTQVPRTADYCHPPLVETRLNLVEYEFWYAEAKVKRC